MFVVFDLSAWLKFTLGQLTYVLLIPFNTY